MDDNAMPSSLKDVLAAQPQTILGIPFMGSLIALGWGRRQTILVTTDWRCWERLPTHRGEAAMNGAPKML